MGSSESSDQKSRCPMCPAEDSSGDTLKKFCTEGCHNDESGKRVPPAGLSPRNPRYVEEDALDEFSRLLRKKRWHPPKDVAKPVKERSVEERPKPQSGGWWTQSGFGEEGAKRAEHFRREVEADLRKQNLVGLLLESQKKCPEGKGMHTFIFDETEKREETTKKQMHDALQEYLIKPVEDRKNALFDARKSVLQDVTKEFFFEKYFFDRPPTPKSPLRKEQKITSGLV